jgi:hypothetical protein
MCLWGCDITHGMATLLSPTQFAVPSFALTPAVMPKGGMSEVSTEPEELPDETPDAEAVEAAGAAEVVVIKVLGKLPPP